MTRDVIGSIAPPSIGPVATSGSASPAERAPRLDYIDSMRAIAALLVLWAHVTEAFAPLASGGRWLNDIAVRLESGRIGVVLFFAISGFVIPYSLRRKAARGPAKAAQIFVVHRFLRLFPAYWVSVAAAALIMPLAFGSFGRETLLANMTMFAPAFGRDDVIGLFWSLRVEVVFYALCLALFVGGVLQRAEGLALATLMALGSYFFGHFLRWWIPPSTWPPITLQFPLYALFLSMMFWGALFRRWRHAGEEDIPRWTRVVLFGYPLLMLALPIVIGVARLVRPVSLGQTIPHAIGIGLFLLLATRGRIQNGFVAWLGRISYSIYLFHPLVFVALLVGIGRGHWLELRAHLALPLLATVVLTIVVSAIVYALVEAPAIRLGRTLGDGGRPRAW